MPGLPSDGLDLGLLGSYNKDCRCRLLMLSFGVVTPPVAWHLSVAQTVDVVGYLVVWNLAIW